MIHSPRFVALIDACVLYPAPIRDLLLNIADLDLYTPKWTDYINEEWTRNLLSNRPDLTERQLQRTVLAMNEAFPDANVINYESLVQSISLPDQDDRHVVAAAVRCKADVIVTANIKDFPNEYLKQFDIEPKHPDNFIIDLIDLNPNGVLEAFENQVSNLRRPPKTDEELLVNFREVGLEATAYELHKMLQNR